MANRILMTGSTGFIGQSMLQYLQAQGYKVDTLNRANLKDDIARGEKNLLWKELGQVDLSQYSAVIHLAGKAHDTKHLSDQREYEEVNYELSKLIFDSWNASDSESFIFMSSILAVKDHGNKKLTEEAEGMPDSHYGISKRKAEGHLKANLPANRNVFILRPALVYGAGVKGNLEKLLSAIERRIPLPLGAISAKRSYLYIENLNRIVFRFMSVCPPSGIYNLADDEQISLKSLIDLMAQLKSRRALNIPIPKVVLSFLANVGDLLRLPYNNEIHAKLTKELLISNDKVKEALNLERMPFSFYEGLKSIVLK